MIDKDLYPAENIQFSASREMQSIRWTSVVMADLVVIIVLFLIGPWKYD